MTRFAKRFTICAVVLLFLIVIGLILAENRIHSASGPVSVVISASHTDTSFYAAQVRSLLAEMEEAGLSCRWTDAEGSLQKQKKDLAELLEYSPRYLILDPVSPSGLDDILKNYAENGTKLIMYNNWIRTNTDLTPLCTISYDNDADGGACAQALADYFAGKEASILEITEYNGTSSDTRLSTGFRNVLSDYQNLSILAVTDDTGGRPAAHAAALALLHEGIIPDAVFAHSDEGALGFWGAMDDLDLSGIPVVSVQGEPEAALALKSGDVIFDIYRDPSIGSFASQVILADQNGDACPSRITLTSENHTAASDEWSVY